MSVDADLVHGLSIARSVDAAGREALATIAVAQDHPRGAVITERGDLARRVFFVLAGRLHGEIVARCGRGVLIDVLEPGDIFGELAALDRGGRVRRVTCASAARLLAVTTADFEDWLTAHPGAQRALLTDLAGRMRDLGERLHETATLDVAARARLALVRRFIAAGALQAGGVLDPAPQRSVIAREIGARREAVSRAISRLERGGVLTLTGGKIVLHDAAALESGQPAG